ncbi:MAG: hypothetical protein RMJ48_07455 [Roseiflexaceae bacterium]|nr:hypothetical protein [Roseiflexaceae bacterium]
MPEIDISSPKYQIVPTGAYSTKYVLDRQDARVGQITLSKEAVRVYDKVWAIEAAHSAGISTPLTWKNIEDIRSYPLFYKQSYEQGGGIRGIARSETELPRKKDGIIFQELIQSKGTYGVAFLADRGKIISYHMHYKSESYPKQGGSAVVIENFSSKELLDYSVRLIEGIDYSGWGLIEYKYCPRRNTFVFMEINAKFWASCEFTFRNNPSFLKLLFDIKSREIPVERMLFLERAIARGFPFLMALPGFLIQGSTVHVYPGWLFRLALRLTPASLRSLAKHVLQGQHS